MQRNNTHEMHKNFENYFASYFCTRTHNIIYNTGKKKTVLLKIKNLHLNEKKKKVYLPVASGMQCSG